MKIYFNRRPVPGPWGGGSKILSSIIEKCFSAGHQIFFEEQLLAVENLDILFCIDPRPNPAVSFEHLLQYKQKHSSCKLIQRVGDLGTHGKPELLELVKKTTQFADVLIFPSSWAKNYLGSNKPSVVIHNAPLKKFVNKRTTKNDRAPLSIVSHHWSNNSMKGFEIYKALDNFCAYRPKEFKFTFIGRKPDNISLQNYIPPLDSDGLVNELPKHDVYITASKLEAGANHVLEAMAVGLPVLYHVLGGSINEYCEKYGMPYTDPQELFEILSNRKNEIITLSNSIDWNKTSEDMAKEYVELFEKIYEN